LDEVSLRFCAFLLLPAAALALFGSYSLAQTDNSAAPATKGKRVCVADVANSSLAPVFTDKLKERLLQDLQKAAVNAYDATAVTVLASQLGLTPANKVGARRQKCDFMVLSEAAKATSASAARPGEQQTSNPPGQLAIHFALFKKRQWSKALTIGSIPFLTEGKDPNPAALAAIDQAASQIASALQKK
jgi:hypothetical protein